MASMKLGRKCVEKQILHSELNFEQIMERLEYGVFKGLKWKCSYLMWAILFEAPTLIKFSQDILYLLGRIWKDITHMWNIGKQQMGARPSQSSCVMLVMMEQPLISRTTWKNVTFICLSALSVLFFFSVHFQSCCMNYLSKTQIWLDHVSAQNL